MKKSHPLTKWISFVVISTFFITSLGITPETFAALRVPTTEVSSLAAGTLAIPAELGQVTETLTGDSKAPAFIHIQSAHGNYQAEKNIEALLAHINKNSSVKLMLLEGAAGKLQPELFRLFPDHPDFNKKVTDKLMREGYLTGPERFLIENADYGRLSLVAGKKLATSDQSPATMQAYGVEDFESYKKDRESFIQVVKKEKSAEKFLGSLRATIDKRFSAKLNKDLLNLVRQEEAFGSGTVSFEGWLKVLGEASKKSLKLDLSDAFYQDQYPFLVRYYRLQEIGSNLDAKKALAEKAVFIKKLEKRGISKEITDLFGAGLGTWDSGLEKTRNQNESRRVSNESRGKSGYSPLRAAFDAAFEKLPKDFSMTQWPNWTLYAQHLILMQEMEGKGLHEEIVKLKDGIQAALAKTAEEKEYLVAARNLYLLRRLFSLGLTRAEYEELRDRHILADELVVGLQTTDQRLQTKGKGLQSPVSSLQSVFTNAVKFYETAVLREEKMFANALNKMREQKQQRAVIVTGGFHADGLKALAASKGCSYIQITPRVNEVTKRDHEMYLKSVLGAGDRTTTIALDINELPVPSDEFFDAATSQMSALLGTVGRAERIAVTGIVATKAWVRDIRALVLGMINSEDVSVRPALSVEMAGFPNAQTILVRTQESIPVKALAGVQRSEMRNAPIRDNVYKKAPGTKNISSDEDSFLTDLSNTLMLSGHATVQDLPADVGALMQEVFPVSEESKKLLEESSREPSTFRGLLFKLLLKTGVSKGLIKFVVEDLSATDVVSKVAKMHGKDALSEDVLGAKFSQSVYPRFLREDNRMGLATFLKIDNLVNVEEFLKLENSEQLMAESDSVDMEWLMLAREQKTAWLYEGLLSDELIKKIKKIDSENAKNKKPKLLRSYFLIHISKELWEDKKNDPGFMSQNAVHELA
ncbi:MAG: hypothetical protein PHV97_04050, partial [Candidatus Omnitrophica bacterium]|nr:hypothetical protein [Candidatus Omnitrophota bacterium]